METGPALMALDTAGYIVPPDAPGADGTLAWAKTTVMPARGLILGAPDAERYRSG